MDSSDFEDTAIDDPDLMGKKKDLLCKKATPLSLIKNLGDKHKSLLFEEDC